MSGREIYQPLPIGSVSPSTKLNKRKQTKTETAMYVYLVLSVPHNAPTVFFLVLGEMTSGETGGVLLDGSLTTVSDGVANE